MRRGKIKSICLTNRSGIIIDENRQTIGFSRLDDLDLELNETVFFEIEMKENGLEAVNIKKMQILAIAKNYSVAEIVLLH
ncbi:MULTISPECIES: hypothetical protein [unclassified Pedobacter]|uniref:hypothetical protein n=1 Tax=unclassified Pedobacter TaxID=2628915 RepID=UPI00141D874B|nr:MULTISPECIES: hypothetical protein [unclassified Pedobacter]NII83473.1 hypothetical protein [Pedobacter sp. SG908]NMN37337.1 hypothetical protein [Pedobacter sp. SG918]